MEAKNLAFNENLSKRCNHPLLPKGITGLIIGKSGCDKTTLLINLLLRPNPSTNPSGIKKGLNSKVLGMFKDEAGEKQIVEFVGLRAKLYSY